MNKLVRYITAGVLLLSLSSCSFFVPKTQELKIVPSDSSATVRVNGTVVGKGTVVANVQRNKSATVTASSGSRHGVAVVDRTISPTGILDIAGGVFFLVPLVGLFSPGAFQLESDNVMVNMK